MSTPWILFQRDKLNPVTPDDLGFIPSFVSTDDPRSAKEQLDSNYQHGGGWHSMPGFMLDLDGLLLTYPGDPPLHPRALAKIRDETVIIYPHDWVVILQQDESFDVCRMD
jgi:hypothetical protein